MNNDTGAHLVPTWSAHGMPRSLVVAVALVLAPFLAVLAMSYPTLALAFAGGVAVAVLARTVPAMMDGIRRRGNGESQIRVRGH